VLTIKHAHVVNKGLSVCQEGVDMVLTVLTALGVNRV